MLADRTNRQRPMDEPLVEVTVKEVGEDSDPDVVCVDEGSLSEASWVDDDLDPCAYSDYDDPQARADANEQHTVPGWRLVQFDRPCINRESSMRCSFLTDMHITDASATRATLRTSQRRT